MLDDLAVAVQGHSIAEIKCYEDNDKISVQYLPTAPGEYTIVLRFNGKDIETMMFKAQITGSLFSIFCLFWNSNFQFWHIYEVVFILKCTKLISVIQIVLNRRVSQFSARKIGLWEKGFELGYF